MLIYSNYLIINFIWVEIAHAFESGSGAKLTIQTTTYLRTYACSSLGACAVAPDGVDVEKMRKFGELIGIAFQIKDDLFDYGKERIGKPTGIDIKEQKMTLPLIHTLNISSPRDKRWIINSVKRHNRDKKRVKEVIDFVRNSGGLEYAVEVMYGYKRQALEILNSYPESRYKESLLLMVDYVIDRKK